MTAINCGQSEANSITLSNALARHKGKPLDLSLTFRLSGLPNHAQLELIQASRSPSVISVALQLPILEGSDISGARLTGKFASTTSIWQILRQFESGAATAAAVTNSTNPTTTGLKVSNETALSSSSSLMPPSSTSHHTTYNFTERAVPVMASDGSSALNAATGGGGAGRLCYQMPVVDFMGRELAGVDELQRTLAQLGFSAGSALLRLSFRQTERPLEDAIMDIARYFKSATESIEKKDGSGTSSEPARSSQFIESPAYPVAANGIAVEGDVVMADSASFPRNEKKEEIASEPQPESHPAAEPLQSPTTHSEAAGSHDRTISIFAPPVNQTPKAATFAHNPDDYETTIESARLHQSRLAASSRNKRLPSDKEVEEQEKAKAGKLDTVKEVIVRVRLPDQSQVQSTFGKPDTAATLYAFVRNMLKYDNQPFSLRYTGAKGAQITMEEGQRFLIKDLLFQGRVLVNFVWNDAVPLEVKKDSVLKQMYQEQATDIEVKAPASTQEMSNGEVQGQSALPSGGGKSGERGDQSKEQKMRKFLGKLTRK